MDLKPYFPNISHCCPQVQRNFTLVLCSSSGGFHTGTVLKFRGISHCFRGRVPGILRCFRGRLPGIHAVSIGRFRVFHAVSVGGCRGFTPSLSAGSGYFTLFLSAGSGYFTLFLSAGSRGVPEASGERRRHAAVRHRGGGEDSDGPGERGGNGLPRGERTRVCSGLHSADALFYLLGE